MISVSSTEFLPVAEVILCLRENIQMSRIYDAVKKRLVLLASGESNNSIIRTYDKKHLLWLFQDGVNVCTCFCSFRCINFILVLTFSLFPACLWRLKPLWSVLVTKVLLLQFLTIPKMFYIILILNFLFRDIHQTSMNHNYKCTNKQWKPFRKQRPC